MTHSNGVIKEQLIKTELIKVQEELRETSKGWGSTPEFGGTLLFQA